MGRLGVPMLPESYVSRFIDRYYLDQEPTSFFKLAVRDELTRRYYRRPEAERRADNRNLYWGASAGVNWHEARFETYQDQQRFHDEYLRSRVRIVEQIRRLLDHSPGMTRVCEIGTGNGLMVEYLSNHLGPIESFQGIDLSAEQISRNKAIYGGSKVEYLHMEVTDYVRRHCRPGTLFVAFGTFECFTQAELEELFALARRTVLPVGFASCDAVDIGYDAESERDSRPRGNLLYSHNYRHLLEKHGFVTCFHQLEHPKPIYDRISILATSFPCPEVMADSQTAH